MFPFATSKKKSHLLKSFYQERIKKCYAAIPYFFTCYLVLVSYYVLDDFKEFDPSIPFTLSRIPSILFSLFLIILRFTNERDGRLKHYWIPLYSITITSIIFSLYAVTFLTYQLPDFFRSGLYIISAAQLTFLLYSIIPFSISFSIIGVGGITFTAALYLQHGPFTSYDIPNFISVNLATIIVLYVKYNYSFKNFINIILLREEKNKSQSLFQLTSEQNEELLQQKNYINNQNNKLTSQYNDIQESLHYAQRIQNAMLPLPFYAIDKIKEYFTFNAPKDIVSGDFYWFGKTDSAQIIVIGDCTGHGVPGALMSMLGISILDRLVTQEQVDDPVYIIEKMHLRLNTLLQQYSTHNTDGLALSVVRIPLFHDENTITYCGAKSPILFIKENQIEFHKGGRYYIGGDISPINKCKNVTIEIEKGMMMYLYSDGFEDQFGGTNDKKYKSSQFKNFLHDISDQPTAYQKQLLADEFSKWKNASTSETSQVDDVLVTGFRF